MHNEHSLCKKKSQNEVLGHFIEFGWFDWFDIAYHDRQKRYLCNIINQDVRKDH